MKCKSGDKVLPSKAGNYTLSVAGKAIFYTNTSEYVSILSLCNRILSFDEGTDP